MYFFLFQAHSGWRWIALLVILIATLKVVIGWAAGQKWQNLDTTLLRAANIALSIQVVLGIILYIIFLVQDQGPVGRLTGGHVVPALLSLGGVGFAVARSRKATDSRQKFMMASIGMIITVILIYGALATVGGIFA
jgi:hypothetical protein